jgi:hypothetical protein
LKKSLERNLPVFIRAPCFQELPAGLVCTTFPTVSPGTIAVSDGPVFGGGTLYAVGVVANPSYCESGSEAAGFNAAALSLVQAQTCYDLITSVYDPVDDCDDFVFPEQV